MSDFRVQCCTPEEAARLLAQYGPSPAKPMLEGHVDVVCLEAGRIVWEIHQKNLVTDYGRRCMGVNNGFWALNIFTSPSRDVPEVGRTSLPDTQVFASQQSTNVTPTYVAGTLTKTWLASFAAPAQNRSIGTVGLSTAGLGATYGMDYILAYTLITPAKVQAPGQTLEVAYKITLNPVY